ncbi:MAG: hypothetical protein LPK45_01085, partial [Bacteroidota bacterium]|nr:hypothetical protein [Bacteroidota bacterium]MDX5429622.1 hypothetical protein [Bacteroidota bacterium]MDX5468406.1 hypothetical protein [Bacteroidota bacterium]
MKWLIIYNRFANGGGSLAVLSQVEKAVKAVGVDYDKLHTAEDGSLAPPSWQEYEKVALVGGDGTLHRLLNTWGVPPIPLCLISGGSGNDFSRLAQGTASLKEQIHHFIHGQTSNVDLGRCNGVWFATGVGIGFDGEVARILNKNSRFKGHLAYLLVVILQIFRYKEKEIEVSHDGGIEKGPS